MTFPDANFTDFTSWGTYSNSLTDGAFGPGILMAWWLIIFLALRQYPPEKGFMTASFLTSLLSILFYVMGWVTGTVAMMPVLLTAIGVAFSVGSDQ